jgi:excisionase family DNA binding protein
MNRPHNSDISAPAQRVSPVASDHRAMPGGWLSVAKAADRAGVHPRTVKNWIKKGYLPATRLPSPKGKGHLRIRLGDLDALVARGALQ